ncbi:hypothetical protein, partial [Sinorhizobium psoraleae]|uniref:hypothetical protein n=1 Tax=Sinorhizobium psoraleae TaxID=520838 RepID=UPI001AED14F8
TSFGFACSGFALVSFVPIEHLLRKKERRRQLGGSCLVATRREWSPPATPSIQRDLQRSYDVGRIQECVFNFGRRQAISARGGRHHRKR